MYKVILFDLWNTLAEITNLSALIEESKSTLGEDRHSKLMKLFVEWHLTNTSSEQFIKDLDKEISIKQEELSIMERFIAPDQYKKYPETDEALSALKEAGVKLVLVTNSPPTSKRSFEKMELAQYFDKTIFSFEIGLMKPNKEIFQEAIKSSGVALEEVLMVGDSLEKDVKGALAAGLNAILIDRKGEVEYENKISSLLELVK